MSTPTPTTAPSTTTTTLSDAARQELHQEAFELLAEWASDWGPGCIYDLLISLDVFASAEADEIAHSTVVRALNAVAAARGLV